MSRHFLSILEIFAILLSFVETHCPLSCLSPSPHFSFFRCFLFHAFLKTVSSRLRVCPFATVLFSTSVLPVPPLPFSPFTFSFFLLPFFCVAGCSAANESESRAGLPDGSN
jgi:hypothetical protein